MVIESRVLLSGRWLKGCLSRIFLASISAVGTILVAPDDDLAAVSKKVLLSSDNGYDIALLWIWDLFPTGDFFLPDWTESSLLKWAQDVPKFPFINLLYHFKEAPPDFKFSVSKNVQPKKKPIEMIVNVTANVVAVTTRHALKHVLQ